jgi:hypothetical protein
VDFGVLVQRNAMYRAAEKRSMDDYKQEFERKTAEEDTAEVECALERR